MKLLFDANVSHKLVKHLASEYPDSTHVRDVGLRGAEDRQIWHYARTHGFAIASKDTDFRERSYRAAGISAPGESEDVVPLVPDLNEPRRLEHLGSLLLRRGHSAARVEKLLGGNLLRLLREVWRT